MFCVRCGTANPATNNFCERCGVPLARTVAPPTAPPTTAVHSPVLPDTSPLLMRLLVGGLAAVILGFLIGVSLFMNRLELGGLNRDPATSNALSFDAAAGGFLPAPTLRTISLDIPRVITIAEQTTVLVMIDDLFSRSSGSGIIVESEGYILTNKHIIEDAKRFTVQLPNGDRVPAAVRWISREHDLALLKVTRSGLKAADLADSTQVRIGEEVVAAGFPLGEELGDRPTMTRGIISRVQTTPEGKTFIQTDAAINPGNSGGPLFNLHGQVVGINTLRYDRAGGRNVIGISWAIPINIARMIVPPSVRTK